MKYSPFAPEPIDTKNMGHCELRCQWTDRNVREKVRRLSAVPLATFNGQSSPILNVRNFQEESLQIHGVLERNSESIISYWKERRFPGLNIDSIEWNSNNELFVILFIFF